MQPRAEVVWRAPRSVAGGGRQPSEVDLAKPAVEALVVGDLPAEEVVEDHEPRAAPSDTIEFGQEGIPVEPVECRPGSDEVTGRVIDRQLLGRALPIADPRTHPREVDHLQGRLDPDHLVGERSDRHRRDPRAGSHVEGQRHRHIQREQSCDDRSCRVRPVRPAGRVVRGRQARRERVRGHADPVLDRGRGYVLDGRSRTAHLIRHAAGQVTSERRNMRVTTSAAGSASARPSANIVR